MDLVPSLTPHHPYQNLERTIWRRPNAGPKVEKKQTVNVESKLKKMMVRIPSAKPILNSAFPKTPIVKDGTTIFAANHLSDAHCEWKRRTKRGRIQTYHASNIEVRIVVPLILRDALNTTLLDFQLASQALQFRIHRVSMLKTRSWNRPSWIFARQVVHTRVLLDIVQIWSTHCDFLTGEKCAKLQSEASPFLKGDDDRPYNIMVPGKISYLLKVGGGFRVF